MCLCVHLWNHFLLELKNVSSFGLKLCETFIQFPKRDIYKECKNIKYQYIQIN